MEGRTVNEKPDDRQLGRALWCVVMAQGGTVKIPRNFEADYGSANILAKLEAFVDPLSGETILKATAERKSGRAVLRSVVSKTLGGKP
jgi:hypothetical protein